MYDFRVQLPAEAFKPRHLVRRGETVLTLATGNPTLNSNKIAPFATGQRCLVYNDHTAAVLIGFTVDQDLSEFPSLVDLRILKPPTKRGVRRIEAIIAG